MKHGMPPPERWGLPPASVAVTEAKSQVQRIANAAILESRAALEMLTAAQLELPCEPPTQTPSLSAPLVKSYQPRLYP
jgi:hypothetical protein